jgi:site-specific DNA-cytosine methylase
MKVLELFAGSRSVGKAGEELGMSVFSSDITQFGGIDYVVDILDFDVAEVHGFGKNLWVPDVIWASPPCTSYSIAGVRHHRNGQEPTSEFAVKSDKIMDKVHELIHYFTLLNPNLVYYIENPRGMLRKMDFMKRHPIRHTVTYCQYGDTRMKPTDIWTNDLRWNPRPMCKNGAPCHEAAPRGSQTGTQGRANNHERSKIPHDLCLEILKLNELTYA